VDFRKFAYVEQTVETWQLLLGEYIFSMLACDKQRPRREEEQSTKKRGRSNQTEVRMWMGWRVLEGTMRCVGDVNDDERLVLVVGAA
jgi:hypothetical protein